MSLDYTITFNIKAKFDYENIKKILSRGKDIGISYFNEIHNIETDQEIDLESAINKVLNFDEKHEFNDLGVKINDETFTTLMFNPHNNSFSLWFTRLYKPNEDILEPFLKQYLKILLDMTENFPINYLTVKDEYSWEELNDYENKFYFILSIKINSNNILQILCNGTENGMRYTKETSTKDLSEKIVTNLKNEKPTEIKFECNDEEGFFKFEPYIPDYSILTDEELARIIELQEYKEKINFKPIYEEVPVFLRFTNLKQNWTKKFQDGAESLDLARYANLMLNLSEGFELKELKIGSYKSL